METRPLPGGASMGLWGRLRGLGGLRLGEAGQEVPNRHAVDLGVDLHYAEGTLRVGIPMPLPGLVDRVEGGVAGMFAYVVSACLLPPPRGRMEASGGETGALRVLLPGGRFFSYVHFTGTTCNHRGQ